MPHYQSLLSSPIGLLVIQATDQAITAVQFCDDSAKLAALPANTLTEQAYSQLEQYFAGERTRFTLPLAPQGSEFRQAAWQALTQIHYGHTISYAEQANRMNNPKAVRAVGAANGANPIAIVIPCHRVIGKNGALTGYNGGIERKQWLLALESQLAD